MPARRSSRRRPTATLRSRPCTGSTLARIVALHRRLSNEQRVTAVSLAREFEVSSRTIRRDIELMRDQIGVPIAWDAPTASWYYTQPCDFLPLLRINADEAVALALAGRTFSAWHGTPLGRALLGALKKIAAVVGDSVSIPADTLDDFGAAPADDCAATEQRHFATLLEARERRRELRITYLKAGDAAPQPRTIHPLHLAYREQRWLLIAHDVDRGQIRTFILGRIHALEPSGAHFQPPAGFDAAHYLSGSLGRFAGGKEYDVRIALDATAAFYAKERPWHPSQALTALPDGRTEIRLRLNNLIDIENAVLRCGPRAEVLAPPELRERVKTAAAAMVALYQSGAVV